MSIHKDKFSEKGENYHAYRPRYPESIMEFLFEQMELAGKSSTKKVVADIATGTGFLMERFVGLTKVIAVDSGATMREVAKANLDRLKAAPLADDLGYQVNVDGSKVLDGRSDETGIASHSVDYIVTGTAAHWFAPPAATRNEWHRILKPQGKVAIVFNFLDKSDATTKGIAELYEETFKVDWSGYRLYETEKVASRFIAKPGREEMTEHFTFTVNKENFLQWLGTMSGPDRKDFTIPQEKLLTDYFEKHCVDKDGEQVINIAYKSTAFVGTLMGREQGRRQMPRDAQAILANGSGKSGDVKIAM